MKQCLCGRPAEPGYDTCCAGECAVKAWDAWAAAALPHDRTWCDKHRRFGDDDGCEVCEEDAEEEAALRAARRVRG